MHHCSHTSQEPFVLMFSLSKEHKDFGGEVYDIVRDEIVVTWGGPLKSAASRENTWPLKSEYATVLRRHRRLSCNPEHQYRGGAMSWQSKLQKCVALSTTEA
ncbi:hypothetical protein AKJ16_DCAP26310 [Drosera capensis]